MPNQPNFQIPAVINPPNTRCICLQIPDDETWITNFVGILAQPTYWFNWQRTGDNSGKQCADVWTLLFDQIDWSTMSCCCDSPPAIYRVNSDGVFQRSTDGGVTWVDAPQYDYRNISTIFPPPSAMGFDNTKCQNADSAVVILNEDVIQGLDNGSAVQALLEFVAAVLILYLSAGTLAEVSIFLFSGAAAIFGFGISATKAAFTSTVLNQLRCSIFNAMSTDDSIDEAGFEALLTDINSHYTGIVKTSLYSIISAAGVVGITNMIRANRGAADADCSACSDTPHVYSWDEIASESTELFPDDLGVYTAHSGISQSGGYYVCSIYFHPELPIPAHWKCYGITIMSDGSDGGVIKYRCSDYALDALSTCSAQFTYRRTDHAFDMTFTIGELCGEE